MYFTYLALPLLAAALCFLIRSRKGIYATGISASLLLVIFTLGLTALWIDGASARYALSFGIFYLDTLSILVLDIITILNFLIHVYSAGYVENDFQGGKIDARRVRLYFVLLNAFVFTMLLSVSVKNMGIMWVAIEATTLASVFLVGFYRKRESLEAAWKYIILCSVGIALAFLGIVFLHLSSVDVLSGESQYLNFTDLTANAEKLDSSILKFAFMFILVGFGTKAGFAPMHTWLPAAHSQAPSPVSAMLSGVLLNSAMYGILRALTIVNRNLGDTLFAGRILIFFGLFSIAIAAIVILTQREYKSLLAYSSIEHMGIIALAAGFFTPASLFAALLHMINHSFTKSMLFLSTGSVLQKYHTTKISQIRGVLKVMPVSGTVFLLGALAIAGAPPFGIFACEWSVLLSIFKEHHFIIGTATALLLAVIFAGIVHCLFGMFYGNAPEATDPGEPNKAGVVVLLALFAGILLLGLWLPAPVSALLTGARDVLMGGM